MNNPEPIACTDCGKKFTNYSAMGTHGHSSSTPPKVPLPELSEDDFILPMITHPKNPNVPKGDWKEKIENIAIKINNRVEILDTDRQAIDEGVSEILALLDTQTTEYISRLEKEKVDITPKGLDAWTQIEKTRHNLAIDKAIELLKK